MIDDQAFSIPILHFSAFAPDQRPVTRMDVGPTTLTSMSRIRSPSFLSKPSIQLSLEQDVIFVHPQAEVNEPCDDPILRGSVVIHVPRKAKIKHIKVELTGLCDAFGEWSMLLHG